MLMARWAESQSFQTQREDLYDSLLFWTFRERREYRARGVSNLRTGFRAEPKRVALANGLRGIAQYCSIKNAVQKPLAGMQVSIQPHSRTGVSYHLVIIAVTRFIGPPRRLNSLRSRELPELKCSASDQ